MPAPTSRKTEGETVRPEKKVSLRTPLMGTTRSKLASSSRTVIRTSWLAVPSTFSSNMTSTGAEPSEAT